VQVGGGVIVELQGAGAGVDHLRRGMVVADGLPMGRSKPGCLPSLGFRSLRRAPCSRICSRTAHNYMDGAKQNSTIWTLARPVYPQVRTVLAGQQAYS
jgi:hypothetical protein